MLKKENIIKKLVLPLYLVFFMTNLLFAQSVKVPYVSSEITIDGKADEQAWQKAPVTTNFQQWFPTDSLKAQEQTRLRFLVDDKNFYVLIEIDAASDNYIIPSLKRDFSAEGSDSVTLVIDPFLDATNAFMFGTNPAGVKREALISNGGNNYRRDFNMSWDVRWESETQTQKGKVVSEMKIPLSSVNFPEGATTWRVNVYRHNAALGEWSTWAPIPQNQNIAGLAFMGEVAFERPLPQVKSPLALIPFISGNAIKDFENATSDSNFSYGGDAKVAIGDGMNLDLTFNPDFSQVEVDDQIINTSRFEIRLPEKRQFFIQNSDLFTDFGDQREAQPFFSRRIGVAKDLDDNTIENKIIAGARLSGKINNNLRLGFLNMQTQEDAANEIAANNNTVFTLQQKVFSRSNVGFIFVNRQQTGNPGFDSGQEEYNRVVGVDYNLASKNNKWTGRTFFHQAIKPTDNDNAYATGLRLQYNSKNQSVVYSGTRIGENYQSDLGFIRRTGILKNYFNYEQRFWLNSKTLRSIQLGQAFFYVGLPRENWRTNDRGYFTQLEVSFLNQAQFNLEYKQNYTYLTSDFNPTGKDDAVELQEGNGYRYNEVEISYRSNRRELLYYRVQANLGQFFNGTRQAVNGEVSYRIQPYFTASVRLNYQNLRFPAPFTSGELWLISPKFDLTFSKKVFWSNFVQYSTQSENFGINSRLQWRFSPLSDFYLVYNDNYFATHTFAPKMRSLTFKLTYWLNI